MRWLDRFGLDRREAGLLLLLIAGGVALRIIATIVMKDDPLKGDATEYHATAVLFADGKPFWGLAPLGEPHESVWKAPLYGAWLGALYTVFGENPFRAELVQAVVGGVTILGAWLLGRHLFGRGVGLAAAAVVAVYPLTWQFGAELYAEALVVPLLTLTLWAFLGREPTPKLAAGVGALVGLNLLLRPTSGFLMLGIAVAFILAAGWRRGALMTGLAVIVAVLVVSPWTIRNAVVTDSFVAISVQDAAIHGTFNEVSASDDEQPYAWRAFTPLTARILDERPRPDEVELRRRLYDAAFEYIGDHPASLPKAFFWNGITRFWDIRRPANAFDDTDFDGRNRSLNQIGLVMYWILLPLAIAGLFVHRRRREIALPLAALFLGASAAFTIIAGTRYRAPLEPLLVVLACSLFAGRLNALADRLLQGGSEDRRAVPDTA